MFLFVTFERRANRENWHACPGTTLKNKSSAERLSCLCIWSFLPLSSIQLTTGCWKVLSAISLSVITTVALCSDPGVIFRARGHVSFHNAVFSPCSGAHCSFFLVAVSFRRGGTKMQVGWHVTKVQRKVLSSQEGVKLQIHLIFSPKSWTCRVLIARWHFSWCCWRDFDRSLTVLGSLFLVIYTSWGLLSLEYKPKLFQVVSLRKSLLLEVSNLLCIKSIKGLCILQTVLFFF